MAAEIAPVILQLKAETNVYLATLRSTTVNVNQMLGAQEKSVRDLEQQMTRSSGGIKTQLRSLAGTLAQHFWPRADRAHRQFHATAKPAESRRARRRRA